jgi:hypothetical protein
MREGGIKGGRERGRESERKGVREREREGERERGATTKSYTLNPQPSTLNPKL